MIYCNLWGLTDIVGSEAGGEALGEHAPGLLQAIHVSEAGYEVTQHWKIIISFWLSWVIIWPVLCVVSRKTKAVRIMLIFWHLLPGRELTNWENYHNWAVQAEGRAWPLYCDNCSEKIQIQILDYTTDHGSILLNNWIRIGFTNNFSANTLHKNMLPCFSSVLLFSLPTSCMTMICLTAQTKTLFHV